MKRIIILILVMIPFLGYGQLKEVQRGALNNSRAEHAINAGINQTNTNTADIADLEAAEGVDPIARAMLKDSLGWSGGFTTEAEAPYFLFYNPLTAAISYYDTTGWGGGTGGGFVIGPAGAVTNRIVTFDGITGELIQDGGNTIAEVLARANHTGTQTASTISDFDVEVANNPAVTLNTAKTGVTSTITVDAINELTLDEGVAIEGVYLENQNIRLNSDQSINFDNLGGAVWIKGNGATDLQFHDTHYDKTLSELVIDTTNLSTRLDTTATDVNANTAAIVLNTAKTTNATHTSEVTGATDLTIADGVIEAVNIESTNVQSDNDGMTYDAASGGFTWGEVVDQVARDSTVANAEDIATDSARIAANTTAIEDTMVYTNYTVSLSDSNQYTPNGYITPYALGLFMKSMFCAEYDTIWDALPDKPYEIAISQNKLVYTLDTAEVWDSLDFFYVTATTTAANSVINLVKPGTYTATTTATFTALEGLKGNGSTTYTNTNFNPVTATSFYSQDDGMVGVYSRTDNTTAGADIGAYDATNFISVFPYNAGNYSYRINQGTNNAITSANSIGTDGTIILQRISSTAIESYHNKTRVQNLASASGGVPSLDIYIGARNNSGTAGSFSDRQISVAFGGKSFSQSKINIITDAIVAYMTEIGKEVE